MYTVWDVEAYLPPPPASWIPRDPGLGKPEIGRENLNRRLVEIDETITTHTPAPNVLQVKLSIAFWRSSFYTRHTGQASRAVRGIAGTGPGITGYWTDVSCGDPTAQNAPNRIYRAGETPTDEGEIPRVSRQGWLTLGAPCTVAIYPINDSYPGVTHSLIPDAAIAPPAIPRDDIALRDPSATLTWVAELSAGTDVTRSGESLAGDDLDLYTFTARRGNVYKFCTIPSGTSACAPETTGNLAELLIIGPDGEVKSGITRDDDGLTWDVPDNGPANDDYVLVVRRRVRWKGSGDPHAYTLKYTAPPIGVCDTLRLTLGAFLFVCTPPKPTDLSAATTADTITATVTPPAGALAIEFAYLAAGANCTTTTEPAATVAVASSDAASGATGAASTPVSHPFGGLSASTTYKLCARSVRTIETGFTLRSGWVEKSATTKAQQLAAPGSPRAGSATTNSLTLTWTAVSDEDVGQYRVKHNRSTATWTVASTETSYKFTGLSAGTTYILSVRALARSGSGRTDSQWEPAASARTKAQSTPPPAFTLSASVSPTRCLVGATVSVTWSTRNGSGDVAVTVNGSAVTTSPTTVRCQTTAGRQEIIVRARDSAGSSARRTLRVTAREAATLVECLSTVNLGHLALWLNNGRLCWASTASALWNAFSAADIAIGCISRPEQGVVPAPYEHYQRSGSGWTNFTIAVGDILLPGSSGCSSYTEASGAAGASASACADAVKPAEGPAAVSVGGTTCLIVRSGGAVEVSDSSHALNLTLPTGRDWALLAAADFIGSSAGAFIFLDLTTGGWLALNPADAAELARHAPADGLLALLDALAASASPPATE